MGLSQDFLTDQISVLDLGQVVTVKPGATLSRTIELMREHRVGCVVIVDDDNRPIGKFTERLLIRVLVRTCKNTSVSKPSGDEETGDAEVPDPISSQALSSSGVLGGGQILDDPVEKHMYRHCTCLRITDPIAKVIECMEAEKLRYVIVLDEDGHPVGITSFIGLIRYVADHFPRQVKVQEPATKLYLDEREGA